MAFDLNAPEAKASMVLHYFHRGLVLLEELDIRHKARVVRSLGQMKTEDEPEVLLRDALVACAKEAIQPESMISDRAPEVVLDHLQHAVFYLDLLDDEALRLIAEHCATQQSGRDTPLLGPAIQALGTCCEQKLDASMTAAPGLR